MHHYNLGLLIESYHTTNEALMGSLYEYSKALTLTPEFNPTIRKKCLKRIVRLNAQHFTKTLDS